MSFFISIFIFFLFLFFLSLVYPSVYLSLCLSLSLSALCPLLSPCPPQPDVHVRTNVCSSRSRADIRMIKMRSLEAAECPTHPKPCFYLHSTPPLVSTRLVPTYHLADNSSAGEGLITTLQNRPLHTCTHNFQTRPNGNPFCTFTAYAKYAERGSPSFPPCQSFLSSRVSNAGLLHPDSRPATLPSPKQERKRKRKEKKRKRKFCSLKPLSLQAGCGARRLNMYQG